MKKLLLLFFILLLLIPCITFSQQSNNTQGTASKPSTVNSNNIKRVFAEDTSEQGMISNFQNMMNNSETGMYAQVISKESKRGDYDKRFNAKRIYTIITFKVFQWIKGSITGDEVQFYLYGGQIGDEEQDVTPYPRYSLNERAIYFLGNKEPNTYLINNGRIHIFAWQFGKEGWVMVGKYHVGMGQYMEIIKQTATDSTAYAKFIHGIKDNEEYNRLRDLKYPNGLMPTDSIDAVIRRRKINKDTTKGGVK